MCVGPLPYPPSQNGRQSRECSGSSTCPSCCQLLWDPPFPWESKAWRRVTADMALQGTSLYSQLQLGCAQLSLTLQLHLPTAPMEPRISILSLSKQCKGCSCHVFQRSCRAGVLPFPERWWLWCHLFQHPSQGH